MLSFKSILGALFVLLIISILVVGWISYQYNEKVISTSQWVTHTYQVLSEADDITSTFKDLQLESNAIYMQGDTSGVSVYNAARHLLFSKIEMLRNLTGDNFEQQARIDSLYKALTRFTTFTDSAVHFPSLTIGSVDLRGRYLAGAAMRHEIAHIILNLKKSETMLLRYREQENQESIRISENAFRLLLLGIVVLILATFISIRYNFNRLMRTEQELRSAQEEISRALAAEVELNKLKGSFIALASHEFRTPLTSILSSTFILDNYVSGANKDKAEKHLARIKSSVNNLTFILDEFLSISKIEEEGVRPNVEQLSLEQHIRQLCSNLQPFARSGQTILYSHEGEDIVTTDPVLVGNIVNNLVNNAIKYSPGNSDIHVYSNVNKKILLTVKDTGIGIPENDQKYLFQRFYRASNAGTIQGTGLGLYIMKHYVEILGGEVTITSEVGKGTEVEVFLPQGKADN